jgi:hypothetical protein
MYKPVSLQGWGARVVTINAIKSPAEKLQDWRDTIDIHGALVGGTVSDGLKGLDFDYLPGQELGFSVSNNEPNFPRTGEAPGIFVLAHRDDGGVNDFTEALDPRIDGFTITGADHAGGIVVNGYADHLQISNNRISANAGFHSGGIRVGDAELISESATNVLAHTDAHNDNITIHHNHITQNGALGSTSGAGGGVSLYTGADDYQLTDNMICGNFSLMDGGGVGHKGLSENGLIEGNTIIFNQSFRQGSPVSGGGIYIAGKPGFPTPADLPTVTDGSGSVQIIGNLIQGNQAGAGDGGGIRLESVNGSDAGTAPWSVDIFNNIIVNNVTGLAGAISLKYAVNTRITNNTIANNDSTATAGVAFEAGSPNMSTAQVAGVALRAHSTLLAGVVGAGVSVPNAFDNNILWHNRSFYFKVAEVVSGTDLTPFGLCPEIGGATALNCGGTGEVFPVYDDLTDATGVSPTHTVFSLGYIGPGYMDGTNNLTADAGFIADYVNGDRGQTVIQPEIGSSIAAQPAFDEGGNFIDVRFGPLTLNVDPTDYHLDSGSDAIDEGETKGGITPLATDFDGDSRPQGSAWDIGADER